MNQHVNEIPGGVLYLNHEANVIDINDTCLQWLQLNKEQIIGKHIESLLTIASKVMFHSYFYPTINLSNQVNELYIHMKNAQNESCAYLMNAQKVTSNEGKIIVCLLMPMNKRLDYEVELRTAKRQLEQAYQEKKEALVKLQQLHDAIEVKQQELLSVNRELLVLSNTDKLTGIANRRLFQAHLDELEQQFKEDQKSFSLLLLDIDYFKKVNDTFGHAVGDIVLQKLAKVLTTFARPEDHVARFGGEEFVMLLPNTDIGTAQHIAEKMNQAVANSDWPEIGGGLTISVGAATYGQGSTGESIIEYADQALYYSKQNGRNRATHYAYIKEGVSKK